MKEGFIYLWYDRKHKRYYVGCHWGTLDDGYVCSSRWMRQAYKRRPEDFKRRILQRGLEKKGLKEHEVKWLSLIKTEELGTRYYNLSKILTGNGWKKGTPRSEETKKRVSEGLKRAYSDGTAGLSSSTFKKGCIPWNKGKTGIYSDETRAKISEARANQVFSDESIAKRVEKLKGRSRPKDAIEKMLSTKEGRKLAGVYSKHVAWNKGLTKDDPRVEKYASKQRGKKRK